MLEKRVSVGTANTFAFVFVFILLQLFALRFSSSAAHAAPRPQEQPREALGSLTTVGEVFLNDGAAPAQSGIFPGDALRTGGTGGATFTLSAKGSFQIYPNTEIIFTGELQYAAELKFGRVAMKSANGATGINLRAGNSVVVAVAEGEQSSSNIEAPSDGSFLVSCVDGSVGVIPLQGGKGIFIRAGQSVGISAQGELSTMSQQPPPPAAPPTHTTETVPAARQKHSYARWILLGVAAAGTGTAVAILSASKPAPPSDISSLSASSSSSGSGSSNPPAPDPPAPPAQPTPQPPPPPPPPPPGPNCHDHPKKCQQKVVIGFAFHF